jgi:hypothetical protein
MAITLEGIALPDLIIENETNWTGVQCIIDRALNGEPIVWEQEMTGKPIDLIGRSDTAWITREILLKIRDLAKVPRAVYVLDYEGIITSVRFRHEEGDVVSALPLVERPNPSNDDWYSDVYIKLMEV